MKNNILGFAVYLMAAILFPPDVAIVLLAIKENSDRCHYYNGEWNKKDLLIGCTAIVIGIAFKYVLRKWFII